MMEIRFADAGKQIPAAFHMAKVIHVPSGQELGDVVAANADERWVERWHQVKDTVLAREDRVERITDCPIKILIPDDAPITAHDVQLGVYYEKDIPEDMRVALQRDIMDMSNDAPAAPTETVQDFVYRITGQRLASCFESPLHVRCPADCTIVACETNHVMAGDWFHLDLSFQGQSRCGLQFDMLIKGEADNVDAMVRAIDEELARRIIAAYPSEVWDECADGDARFLNAIRSVYQCSPEMAYDFRRPIPREEMTYFADAKNCDAYLAGEGIPFPDDPAVTLETRMDFATGKMKNGGSIMTFRGIEFRITGAPEVSAKAYSALESHFNRPDPLTPRSRDIVNRFLTKNCCHDDREAILPLTISNVGTGIDWPALANSDIDKKASGREIGVYELPIDAVLTFVAT